MPTPLPPAPAQPEVLTETFQLFDTSTCCEDCPDVNPDPPEKSECPYFDTETAPEPLCTRVDRGTNEFRKWMGNGPGNTALETQVIINLNEG